MRKLAIGLVTLALAGAVGCGKNNEDNNANNTNNTENNTDGVNNENNSNNSTNNETNNSTNNETNNSTNNETNNSTNNETNNSTNNETNNSTNNATNNMTNNTTGDSPMCVAYCATVVANCAGEAQPGYADEAACLADCANVADTGTDCSADLTTCDTSGDSIQCRAYHADAAGGDAATHCPHASGEAPCS